METQRNFHQPISRGETGCAGAIAANGTFDVTRGKATPVSPSGALQPVDEPCAGHRRTTNVPKDRGRRIAARHDMTQGPQRETPHQRMRA
jgi:hypothetical protein